MKLVSMERPKPSVKEETKGQAIDNSYYEKYPWGLRLDLGNDELDKLGIKISGYDVDSVVNITAKALITSISSSQSLDSGSKKSSNNRIELQITDLAIEDLADFGTAFKEATDEK